MVTIGPSQRDGASAVALGALVLLSLWVGAVLATNRLIRIADELTAWQRQLAPAEPAGVWEP